MDFEETLKYLNFDKMTSNLNFGEGKVSLKLSAELHSAIMKHIDGKSLKAKKRKRANFIRGILYSVLILNTGNGTNNKNYFDITSKINYKTGGKNTFNKVSVPQLPFMAELKEKLKIINKNVTNVVAPPPPKSEVLPPPDPPKRGK